MLLLTNRTITIEFNVSVGTTSVDLTSPLATVIRNGTDTTVVTNVYSPSTGRYVVTFTIPGNWVFPDNVAVRLEGTYEGLTPKLTKQIGQVITTDIISSIDYLEKWSKADEVVTSDTYTRYEEGTTNLLLTKQVTKDGDNLELRS